MITVRRAELLTPGTTITKGDESGPDWGPTGTVTAGITLHTTTLRNGQPAWTIAQWHPTGIRTTTIAFDEIHWCPPGRDPCGSCPKPDRAELRSFVVRVAWVIGQRTGRTAPRDHDLHDTLRTLLRAYRSGTSE